ncbi:D-alanine--D-alanine ligase [Selenomonas sp. TAMA-11512]|uniref:D-alanine--D-alanine ligase family protein n=1 Tax=Selenomonas sp. TAMA-11512 TaxID=3095337 RepID=UPI003089A049|nr:D-alanine--D-alanine ligase [Selenomonas sp. TAMA-11512]
MTKGLIIVVMGGPSTEAEVSRRTGTEILKALKSKGYPAEPLELDPPHFAETILAKKPAIVFNALHGRYGEDGLMQGTLDMLGIPYTGSGVLAAAVTMDKAATKRIFFGAGIPTPPASFFHRSEAERAIEMIKKDFSFPLVVKAVSQGSSIGVVIVEREEELGDALKEAFRYDEEILVETFIRGRELTVAVKGTPTHAEALPVIEIVTTTGRYDYETKYKPGASAHIVPAELSEALTASVQEIACEAFRICGCKGVARVDFMLAEDDTPYAIEVNSVPGMTETSLVPDAARAAGQEFPELCEEILQLAGY